MSNQTTQPNSAPATTEGRNSIGAFLKLFRVSNAPTIITNTFVGASVAALMEPGSFPHITNVIVVSIGLVFIYIAGMATNDYFDQVIDARERPTRPIPSRQISSGTALIVGVLFLLIGMTPVLKTRSKCVLIQFHQLSARRKLQKTRPFLWTFSKCLDS